MRFKSKEELLERIEQEHDALLALAAGIPRARCSEPGVWGEDWSINDLFAHLTEWHRMLLGWHTDGLAGRTPVMPAPGYKWGETPRLNRAIQRHHAKESTARVMRDFDESYREVLALVRGLPEKQLQEPGHFAWTRKLPISAYIGPNTCSHYRFASKILKRWRKSPVRMK